MKPGFLLSAALLSSSLVIKPLPGLAQTVPPSATVAQLQDSFVKIAASIKPSVVTIYAERLPANTAESSDNAAPGGRHESPATPNSPIVPSLPDDSQSSLGSGMVIDNRGHILTNYHVVKDAAVIRVVADANADLPARPVAKLIGYDLESDLAVLQVTPSPSFVPVQFGDSNAVRVGDWVLAIGDPFDQAQTVTVGVISAKGRHLAKDGQMSLQKYLQTDAAINPGNSGGPLVNMQGKVIGINTAILSPSRYSVGIGFAVPSSTIERLLPILLQGKRVERGFLGVRYLPISSAVAAAFGVPGGMQIGALAERDNKPYGPAFDAGLRKGDIITSVNGEQVSTSALFRYFVSTLLPGSVIQLDVLRPLPQSVQHRSFEITLGDRNEEGAAPSMPVAPRSFNLPQFGLQVEDTQELTAAQRTLLEQPLESVGKGANLVIILHVRLGSSADDVQLRQSEIIEKINIMRSSVTGEDKLGSWLDISDKAQLIKAVQDLPPGTKVLVELQDKRGILLYKLLTSRSPGTP